MARNEGTGSEGTEAGSTQEPTKEAAKETPETKEEAVKVEEKTEEPEIKVAPGKIAQKAAVKSQPAKPKKKMFRIIIDEQDNSDKNGDVFVTDPSDGTPFLMQRGSEVDVPEGVVNNLKECIIEKLEYDKEGNERWRKIPRYAMRIIKEL
jgi:hypothetical protein